MTQLQCPHQPHKPAAVSPSRSGGSGLGLWLGLAAVLHLSMWPLGRHLLRQPEPAARPQRQRTKLGYVDAGKALQRDRERRKAAPKPPQQHEQLPNGEVIEVAPDAAGRPPPKTTRLAQRSSAVARETRSRTEPKEAKVVSALAKPPQPGAGPERAKSTALAQGVQSPGSNAAAPHADPPKRSPLGLHGPVTVRRDPSDRAHGSPAAGRKVSLAELMPSMGALSLLPGGPADKGPQGVEEGESTALNAREFRFASFFSRLRRSIAQVWHPAELLRLRDPTGTLYGSRPRHTGVQIELDGQGAVTEVALRESCGLDFLDDEAMAAVRRAAPYVHPPAGLLDPTGHISFGFSFYIEMDGHMGMHSEY